MLANTSANQAAQELLDACLSGQPWSRELATSLTLDPALVRVVAEGLGDRFEPVLVDHYVEIFTHVLAPLLPGWSEGGLHARYQRIRRPKPFSGSPDRVRNVYVLSRVTLGADVAITSVLLDAVKRRFPQARIWLCGSRKVHDLYEADSNISFYRLEFTRGGSIRDNLGRVPYFKDGIVVDPDSRITQLGLIPVCTDENYFFFESRSYGADTDLSLCELTQRWAQEIFDIEAKPYIAPRPQRRSGKFITVSLGTGDNPAKSIREPFERLLLEKAAKLGPPVLVDLGASNEERARVLAAAEGLENIEFHEGFFARFASLVAQSALFYGYDSAAAHVAAVTEVPMIAFFKGAVNDRFFSRWCPHGAGRKNIIQIDDADPDPNEVIEMLG